MCYTIVICLVMAIHFKHQILLIVLYLTDQLIEKVETQKKYVCIQILFSVLVVYSLLYCAIYTHFEFRIILLQRKRQKERGLLDKIINYPSIMRLILWLTILCTLIFPLVSSTKPSAFDLYKKNHNKGNLSLTDNFFLQKVKNHIR